MQLKKVDCFEGTRFYVFSRSSRRLSAGYCTRYREAGERMRIESETHALRAPTSLQTEQST